MSTEEERWARHVERKAALDDTAEINRLTKVTWTTWRASPSPRRSPMADYEIHHTITLAGDPVSIAHNEQMAALARDDLARHVRSAAAVFEQGADSTNATVVMAMSLIEHDAEDMPRERLAALLAAALVRLAQPTEEAP